MSIRIIELREGLEIVPRLNQKGQFRYLVKDSSAGGIYELGEEEYFLCSHFDGRPFSLEILSSFQDRFQQRLSLHQLEAFVRKLRTLGLLSERPEDVGAITEFKDNSYFLFNPDPFFRAIECVLRGCFSLPCKILLVLFTILSIGIVTKFFSYYVFELQLLRQDKGAGVLLLVPLLGYLLVYPLAEVAKGIACRYYGGQTSGFYVHFIFKAIPKLYVDIWDALWILEKNNRMKVLFAGIAAQLIVWNISVLLWKCTTPWSSVHIFCSFFSFTSFLFLLFNINPLLQRDGYLILSYWLEISDFKSRAVSLARSRITGDFLPEPLTICKQRLFMLYGVSFALFKAFLTCIVLFSLGYILTQSFQGVGALMFVLVLYLRFEEVVGKQLQRIPIPPGLLASEKGAVRARFLLKIGLLLGLIVLLLFPYPFEVGGEFKVLPTAQLGIRAEVAGRIQEVLVVENELVVVGQPVAVLGDRVHRKKVEAAQAALDEATAVLELRRSGPKPEQVAIAEQEVITASKNLDYSEEEAVRFENMFKQKAVPETEYRFALRSRDLDLERYELANRNLDFVLSGARQEELKALEAEVRRYEVELSHAEDDLQRTTLVSPINGVVITPYLDQKIGQRLEIGELFAVVENNSKIIAEIEVPEKDIGEVTIGAKVKLRTWGAPNRTLKGETKAIAPIAYEKSLPRIERTLTERESLFGQREVLRKEGKVVRVLTEFTDQEGFIHSDMTGYAKIACDKKPVGIAFTRWLVRFFMVEVWSWIP